MMSLIKPVIERDHDKHRQPEGEAGGEKCIGFVHLKIKDFSPNTYESESFFPNWKLMSSWSSFF